MLLLIVQFVIIRVEEQYLNIVGLHSALNLLGHDFGLAILLSFRLPLNNVQLQYNIYVYQIRPILKLQNYNLWLKFECNGF